MELLGRNLVFLLVAAALIVSLTEGHKYHVGGNEGWIVNPRIHYNHWSDLTRFVINDSLVFNYKKGEDSVLLVTKDGYYNCDTKSPVERWEDGATEVALNRSGAFFFISGAEHHCHKGQRVIVVVLPWSPRPPVSLAPESPLPHPPHSSPTHPPTVSPSTPDPHAPTPASTPSTRPSPPPPPSKAPSLSPADHPPASLPPSPLVIPPTHSPTSTPTEAPPPQSTASPSPSSDTPIPAAPAPAPAPEESSASAIASRHAPLVIAAVTLFLSAIFLLLVY